MVVCSWAIMNKSSNRTRRTQTGVKDRVQRQTNTSSKENKIDKNQSQNEKIAKDNVKVGFKDVDEW